MAQNRRKNSLIEELIERKQPKDSQLNSNNNVQTNLIGIRMRFCGLTLNRVICRACNPEDVAGFWSLAFGLSKIVELGDTMFIVLRKRPLIFLHYYHHSAVMIYASHTAAEHAGPGQVCCIMNMFAHSVMYTYYAYTSTGKKPSKWIAMGVTTIQTTQMFLGVLVTCYVYYLKVFRPEIQCQQSMGNLYLAFFLYITFAILFVQFFVRTYIKQIHKRYQEITTKKID